MATLQSRPSCCKTGLTPSVFLRRNLQERCCDISLRFCIARCSATIRNDRRLNVSVSELFRLRLVHVRALRTISMKADCKLLGSSYILGKVAYTPAAILSALLVSRKFAAASLTSASDTTPDAIHSRKKMPPCADSSALLDFAPSLTLLPLALSSICPVLTPRGYPTR